MLRAAWLKKKQHGAETIRCENGDFYVITHDDKGRQSEGFGATEEKAFADAFAKYTVAQARAKQTTKRYGATQFTGRIGAA